MEEHGRRREQNGQRLWAAGCGPGDDCGRRGCQLLLSDEVSPAPRLKATRVLPGPGTKPSVWSAEARPARGSHCSWGQASASFSLSLLWLLLHVASRVGHLGLPHSMAALGTQTPTQQLGAASVCPQRTRVWPAAFPDPQASDHGGVSAAGPQPSPDASFLKSSSWKSHRRWRS